MKDDPDEDKRPEKAGLSRVVIHTRMLRTDDATFWRRRLTSQSQAPSASQLRGAARRLSELAAASLGTEHLPRTRCMTETYAADMVVRRATRDAKGRS
ncbi:hypothetical protein CSOJ01_00146 [Colletotrichum sojae]|uniref:Uncharacterized protein n=1 Tax=Colletotrichum sojae TaxID=2175907 RepID=A0A8H6N6P9_9PEZI|nr:hypothetical protein CSOJ01_00146 [Colletotrichum sojae]